MKSETVHMAYTKDNGDVSNREVIVVSAPRDNYLVYDVTKLTEKQIWCLKENITNIEDYSNHQYAEFKAATGININSLWRSFKPGGIDWKE